jgi:glycosyltransferase involved in cell wall biosynthesis
MITPAFRVTHVASNPEYAGLERHVASLIATLQRVGGVEPSLVVFHDGRLVEEVRGLGVPVEVVPLRWVFDAKAITRLAQILRSWKIDCLHSHGYKANVIGALAALRADIKAIVRTEHSRMEPFQGFDRLKMETYEAINTWVGNRLTDRIITVSDDLRGHLAPRYPKKTLVTVHNGIRALEAGDPQILQAKRASLGVDQSAPLIGIVGRLMPVKSYSDFLKAAALIYDKRPDTQFLVAGDGPLSDSLKEEAMELGLASVIHFLGFRTDVRDWMATLDLLVFSSLSEGVPYSLLEAMSLGVPVVATAVGGLSEIIEDGVTGLLVQPKDPEALAHACLELLNDPGRRQQMATASRQRCAVHFSDLRMAEAIHQVYHEVTSQDGEQEPASKQVAFPKTMAAERTEP